MPDGFDVRPEQLRRGAADLRSDADGLDDAVLRVGAAFDDVSVGCRCGSAGGGCVGARITARPVSPVHPREPR